MKLRSISEWRTLALVISCYLLLSLLILNPFGLPLYLQAIFIIPLITLHSSLQHECIHRHPFASQALNDALIFLPVGILLPYFRFKASHIKHHHNSNITDPYEDPESGYWDSRVWERRSSLVQKLFEINNTLAGRMLIGPALSIIRFAAMDLMKGNIKIIATWIFHTFASALILMAVFMWSNMPVWGYLLCCYAGYSLLTVRTFLEHQADESIRARTVIVEDKGIFGFLFLHNNLHVVHHAYPTVAWYELPKMFEKNRDRFLMMNKGYYFKNYAEIFKQYGFSKKEPVAYPLTSKGPLPLQVSLTKLGQDA
ncbi:MAG: fatty acid desaturase [Sneathiella sp.]